MTSWSASWRAPVRKMQWRALSEELAAEHAALLNEQTALEQEQHYCHHHPSDMEAHRRHIERLREHRVRLREHILKLRAAHGSAADVQHPWIESKE